MRKIVVEGDRRQPDKKINRFPFSYSLVDDKIKKMFHAAFYLTLHLMENDIFIENFSTKKHYFCSIYNTFPVSLQ